MARPKSDIDRRIVAAAARRFLVEGVDGASLRRIAREAKTNLGMVYYYFPTKDDLFLAVVESVYADLLADLEAALVPEAPFAERVRRLYARLGAMTDREVDVVRLIVREGLVSSARLARIVERFSRGHLPLVLSTIQAGLASGEVRGDLPPILLAMSTVLVGLVPQILLRIVPELPVGIHVPEGEARTAALVELVLGGVAAPGDPAPAAPGDAAPKRARRA